MRFKCFAYFHKMFLTSKITNNNVIGCSSSQRRATGMRREGKGNEDVIMMAQ